MIILLIRLANYKDICKNNRRKEKILVSRQIVPKQKVVAVIVAAMGVGKGKNFLCRNM